MKLCIKNGSKQILSKRYMSAILFPLNRERALEETLTLQSSHFARTNLLFAFIFRIILCND